MRCSAAVDVLFLLDGSHSVGKAGFERSKHFAITLCDALDISPNRVSRGFCIQARLIASDKVSLTQQPAFAGLWNQEEVGSD